MDSQEYDNDEEEDTQSSTSDAAINETAEQQQTQSSTNISSSIKYRYTMNKLLELRNSPYSKRRPEYADKFMARGCIKRSSNSPVEEPLQTHRNNRILEKRRHVSSIGNTILYNNGDPRDRLKKENDIILSPQRRSFNMGCQMPSASPSTTSGRNDRDMNNRMRIGSGRIVSRDVSWDYKPERDGENDFNFRSSSFLNSRERDRERDSGNLFTDNSRDDQKFYNNRTDTDRDISKRNRSKEYNSNYNSNHGYYMHKDEEPEWYSGGPTSQNDTIELCGFNEHKTDSNKTENSTILEDKKSTSKEQTSTDHDNDSNKSFNSNKIKTDLDQNTKYSYNNDLNFEEFFKLDQVPGFLPNDDSQSKEGNVGSSRFSQWFRHDSPTSQIKSSILDSPRSSIQEG